VTYPAQPIVDMLQRIYPVSRETIDRLVQYEKLLRQWQAKTNLVAPSTLEDFWTRHIADSLQILAISPKTHHWTDIGSGGGLPGIVIAILMKQVTDMERVQTSVHLVESIQKKCAFLRRVSIETGIDPEIHSIRIESATKQLEACEVVTARALASLPKLLELTECTIQGERKALFHKGRDYLREIEDCDGQWNFDLVVHKSKVDDASVILELSNVRAAGSIVDR
jgi:16S rRNA (guanine527-N7)-methyltransferase